MKRQRNIKIFWFGLICWAFLGCTVPSILKSEIPSTPSATNSIVFLKTDTEMLASTPSRTPISATHQIILPQKTMSPQESEFALLELLRTNGNCEEKCIAGIWPDEMTMQEAITVMAKWGMMRTGKNTDGEAYVTLIQNQLHENVMVYLSIRTSDISLESIEHVSLRIEGSSNRYLNMWKENQDVWKGYYLNNLLKSYGVPSYVGYFFQTTVTPGSSLVGRTISYLVNIQYERINLVVELVGLAFYDGENLSLCPSKDPHHLLVEINPERSLDKKREFYPVTWQALTETDLESFYRMFTDKSNPDAYITTTLEQIQSLQPSFR